MEEISLFLRWHSNWRSCWMNLTLIISGKSKKVLFWGKCNLDWIKLDGQMLESWIDSVHRLSRLLELSAKSITQQNSREQREMDIGRRKRSQWALRNYEGILVKYITRRIRRCRRLCLWLRREPIVVITKNYFKFLMCNLVSKSKRCC